jgi:hypothetical protein
VNALRLAKAATYEDPHYRGTKNQGARMAAREPLQIGHHLLHRVLSDVLGCRVYFVGSCLREPRDAVSTWETRCALLDAECRIRQYAGCAITILINGVGASLCYRLHPSPLPASRCRP